MSQSEWEQRFGPLSSTAGTDRMEIEEEQSIPASAIAYGSSSQQIPRNQSQVAKISPSFIGSRSQNGLGLSKGQHFTSHIRKSGIRHRSSTSRRRQRSRDVPRTSSPKTVGSLVEDDLLDAGMGLEALSLVGGVRQTPHDREHGRQVSEVDDEIPSASLLSKDFSNQGTNSGSADVKQRLDVSDIFRQGTYRIVDNNGVETSEEFFPSHTGDDQNVLSMLCTFIYNTLLVLLGLLCLFLYLPDGYAALKVIENLLGLQVLP